MKKIGLLKTLCAIAVLSAVIAGCEAKSDLPPIYPIGVINAELADSNADMVYLFKAKITLNFDVKQKKLREELELKHMDIMAAIQDAVALKSSSDIDVTGDMADLNAELVSAVNALLENGTIESVTFDQSAVETATTAAIGDEE